MKKKIWRNLLHVPANLGHQQSGTEKQEAKNPVLQGTEPDPKQIKGQKASRVFSKSGTALRSEGGEQRKIRDSPLRETTAL